MSAESHVANCTEDYCPVCMVARKNILREDLRRIIEHMQSAELDPDIRRVMNETRRKHYL